MPVILNVIADDVNVPVSSIVLDVIILQVAVRSMNELQLRVESVNELANDIRNDDGIVPDYDGLNVRVRDVGEP